MGVFRFIAGIRHLGAVAAATAACLIAQTAVADLPGGVILDDAYTWFSAKSVEEPVDGKMTDRGWSLQYGIRFLGDVPAFSAVRTVVSKDGRKLAEHRKSYTQGHANTFASDGRWMVFKKTEPADDLIIGDGEFDVDLYFINGSTDEETRIREYTLDVRKVHRQHHLRFINPPHYFVNHHGNVKDAIISQRAAGDGNYMTSRDGFLGGSGGGASVTRGDNTGFWEDRNWVTILINVTRDDDRSLSKLNQGSGSRLAGTVGRMIAKVDGETIDLTHPELRQQDAVFATLKYSESVMHTDRYAEEYHSGTEYREPLGFAKYMLNLSLTWGPEDKRVPSFVALDDHPGDWELKWVVNGEVLRTFYFTVGKDGLIEPHEDEDDADLSLPPRTHLVEMKIPDGGSSLDSRLTDEFVDDYAFYGLGLPRSLRSGIPDKGNPFPQFSGPKVEPADPGAADRERREALKQRQAAEQAAAKAEREAAAAERAANLQAEREAYAAEEARRAEEAAQRDKDIERMVEEEKARAMAEVERLKGEYADAADEVSRNSGLPLWIRLLLSVALIGAGLALAGSWLTEKVAAVKPLVAAVQPMGTLLGWALIALALVGVVMDLFYLQPLVANGVPQIVAIVAGLMLARGAIKEKLSAVEGDAGEQAAKAAAALEAQEARLAALDGKASTIGLVALVAGLLHLVAGGSPLI